MTVTSLDPLLVRPPAHTLGFFFRRQDVFERPDGSYDYSPLTPVDGIPYIIGWLGTRADALEDFADNDEARGKIIEDWHDRWYQSIRGVWVPLDHEVIIEPQLLEITVDRSALAVDVEVERY